MSRYRKPIPNKKVSIFFTTFTVPPDIPPTPPASHSPWHPAQLHHSPSPYPFSSNTTTPTSHKSLHSPRPDSTSRTNSFLTSLNSPFPKASHIGHEGPREGHLRVVSGSGIAIGYAPPWHPYNEVQVGLENHESKKGRGRSDSWSSPMVPSTAAYPV